VVIDVVAVSDNGLINEVSCYGCKQSWSVLRLVTLAMSNPTRRFFLDVEAIALWLGLTPRQVYKVIKANKIASKGQLYDLAAIIASR
jgi:hypothetical protein